MKNETRREILESFYWQYHRAEFLHSDPLKFPRQFESPEDREVVALIAASFAFGNAKSIFAAIETLLAPLGPHPAKAIAAREPKDWSRLYKGFVYRWVREDDVRVYLAWIGSALRTHGSLEQLWHSVDHAKEKDILPALQRWIEQLTSATVHPLVMRRRQLRRANCAVSVLPSGAHLLLTPPSGKSSCKRMNLFLRWVCRPDDGVDMGLWNVSPARLVMPVDTHVLQMARALGITRRKTADLKTAMEITARLRKLDPNDPVRYDFSLVRPGMMRLREVIAQVKNTHGTR